MSVQSKSARESGDVVFMVCGVVGCLAFLFLFAWIVVGLLSVEDASCACIVFAGAKVFPTELLSSSEREALEDGEAYVHASRAPQGYVVTMTDSLLMVPVCSYCNQGPAVSTSENDPSGDARCGTCLSIDYSNATWEMHDDATRTEWRMVTDTYVRAGMPRSEAVSYNVIA